jgi:hypothetical protein
MKIAHYFFLLAATAILAGCSSSKVDARPRSTSTSINLNEKNYRLIQPGASGTSYGFRLLGIIPFASPHFATARQDLYDSINQPIQGKAIALSNELEDKSTLYLILFSVPKFTLTADVIEFTDLKSQ